MPRADRKGKRIVVRLSKGLTANKKRRFTLSKLKHFLGDITQETLENQIHILESHAVVSCPTRKSVELTRDLSLDVQTYLITHCTFTPPQVVDIMMIRWNCLIRETVDLSLQIKVTLSLKVHIQKTGVIAAKSSYPER